MPNLYDSLLERLEGRQYSNYFSCFCPFDTHKSPALLVYDDGYFVCLSCGKKGSHSFLDKKIGSHFRPQQRDNTVSRVLPRWKKWEKKYGDLDGIANAAHRALKSHKPFQTYFRKRKIYDFVDEGHLGYMDGWATFPVYSRDSKIIDIVVRSISIHGDVRYVVKPDEHVHMRPIYCPSWKKVEDAQTIYVVYGIIDSIALHLAGLPSITGTTGKSLNVELLKPLGKRFIIIPDVGEEYEAHKLANELGWRAKVKEIEYVDGCKDPDDIRKTFGNEYLLHAIGA